MHEVICALLTYLDMHPAMAELDDEFGLEVGWLGTDAAEIRWDGGVAVAPADQPEALHGSHAGHGWTSVRVADPDAHYARALSRDAHVLNEPHSGPGGQRGYSACDREGNLWTFARHKFGR
jgi:uncharacterized glyoxalase superfamily protein PhnB